MRYSNIWTGFTNSCRRLVAEALLRNGERHLPYQQRVLTTGLASSLRQSLALSGQSGVPLSVPLLQETLSLPQQAD